MLVCGIPKEKSLSLSDIRTSTMRDARLKGRAAWAHVEKITYFMVIKEVK
jgi:hypothetical protein